MQAVGVEKALEARTKVWKNLLDGESERWTSIEDLRNLYRTAANRFVSAEPIKALWDGKTPDYEYFIVAKAN
jgi:hypothetical protein